MLRGGCALRVALATALMLVVSGCGARSTLDPGQLASAGAPSGAAPHDDVPASGGGMSQQPHDPPTQPPVAQPIDPVAEPPLDPPSVPPVEPLAPDPCESFDVTIDELRPAVTLLVDQSGSMRSGFPEEESELTRWKMVRQALLDPTSGVVPSLQSSIQFGLVFYTSHNGFSGGGTCPILNDVKSATNNYDAIAALYDSMWPDDDTPTGAAVRAAVAKVINAQRKGPELILLVTDGDPDTCQQPDPQDGQAEAISGAEYAHRAGIDFYVLGISSDISGDKLQQLANAGQGKRLDAVWGVDADAAEPFQASSSVAGFTAQLRSIVERVPLCSIELDRPITGAELAADSVQLDGKRLVQDAADGFELTDARHLQVLGKACDKLRASGKRLSVRIACDAE